MTLLIGPQASGSEASVPVVGFLALTLAGISWASGSLFARHAEKAESPWMNAAAQMICGGAGLLILALLSGEPWKTDWHRFSRPSLLALAYLIVCGSWIGYSAYVWLLKVSTPARVATYAYVNPIIAVLLGWALLGEPVNARMVLGALVIIAGLPSSPSRNRPSNGCSPESSERPFLRRQGEFQIRPAAR